MTALAERAAKPRTVLVQVEPVAGEQRLSDSFGRIGGNLTPQSVSAILAEADSGNPARLVDLMHEARQKDGHLQAVLETRELALQALEWDIVAPGDKPLKREKKVTKFCKDVLSAMSTFPQMLAHLTGESLLFGHATSELMWRKQGAFVVPEFTEQVSCRRFRFTESSGRLVFVENQYSRVGVDLLEEYPGKFIQVRRRVNGDVPVREGLCRALLWAALFRNWGITDWLKLAEMSWKPWRTAKFKKEKIATLDVAAMRRILEGMTSNGIALYPDTWELEVKWPQFSGSAAGSNHTELVEFMGREISKAVLGGTDTVEPGKNGSRASTEVRNEVRHDRRDADALAIGAEIKRHLLEPLVKMNFGESAVVPEFFFLTEDPEDLEKFSKSILTLRTAGLKIPTSYVYEKTGIQVPKEGDELVGDGLPMTPAPGAKPDGSQEDDSKPANQAGK
jgi:phage gp29-like protein